MQSAAKRELAAPAGADAQAELGEAWLNVGEKEKEKTSAFPKIVWQEHGAVLIRGALAKLQPVVRNKLQSRLLQFDGQRKAAGLLFIRRRPLDVDTFYAGHWYKFYHTKVSWLEAKAQCEALGGYLVCVETPAENQFVKSIVFAGTQDESMFVSWIGANDIASEGKFVWLDGSPLEYFDWMASEPSGSNESYVGYIVNGPSTLTMKWGDQADYHRGYFLCEWNQ